MHTIARLWTEETGAILSAEIMLVATILVIGVIVGLKSIRDSVVTELADVAQALDNASQSFWFKGSQSRNGWSNGGSYSDGQYNQNGQSSNSSKCVDTAASAYGAAG